MLFTEHISPMSASSLELKPSCGLRGRSGGFGRICSLYHHFLRHTESLWCVPRFIHCLSLLFILSTCLTIEVTIYPNDKLLITPHYFIALKWKSKQPVLINFGIQGQYVKLLTKVSLDSRILSIFLLNAAKEVPPTYQWFFNCIQLHSLTTRGAPLISK